MAKWLKDNAVGLISLLLTFGSSVAAFFLGVKAMIASYPLQSFLLAIAAFSLGFLALRLFEIKSRYARDKRTLQNVKGLSVQLLDAIHQAYKNGSYDANIYDPTVQHLLNLGYLGAPSMVSRLYETEFVLQPWFKNFLDRHYDQVFDSKSSS